MMHFKSVAYKMGRRRRNDLLQRSVHGAKVGITLRSTITAVGNYCL